MLKITDLTYSYNIKNRTDNYNFSLVVQKNEIVGIMGESGSGKSTLLDLIAGFLKPKSGNIFFQNKNIGSLDAEKRPTTILFQKYNTFEHLSVIKNVLLGVTTSLKPKIDDYEKAKKILSQVGLEGIENKIVSTLSGGENQRVALARSLLREESILLLDEAFSGLDLKTKVKMLELVQKISKEKNLYTIMVTHELNDCKQIANRIYTVVDGKLMPSTI